jgi:hypothetical protein
MHNKTPRCGVVVLLVGLAWFMLCPASIGSLVCLPPGTPCDPLPQTHETPVSCQAPVAASLTCVFAYACVSTPIDGFVLLAPPAGHTLPLYRPPRFVF